VKILGTVEILGVVEALVGAVEALGVVARVLEERSIVWSANAKMAHLGPCVERGRSQWPREFQALLEVLLRIVVWALWEVLRWLKVLLWWLEVLSLHPVHVLLRFPGHGLRWHRDVSLHWHVSERVAR